MFPWVYGFEWTAGNVTFGLFFQLSSHFDYRRSGCCAPRRAFKERRQHEVEWESTFEDLVRRLGPVGISFLVKLTSMCRHGFECKDCSFHKQMLDSAYKLVGSKRPLLSPHAGSKEMMDTIG